MSKQQDTDVLVVFGALASIPAVTVLGLALGIYRAFAMWLVYGWLIAPFGAPDVPLIVVWGLVLVYRTLVYRWKPTDEGKAPDKSLAEGFWLMVQGSLADVVATTVSIALAWAAAWAFVP